MLSDICALLVPADNLLQQRAELYENALITAMRKSKNEIAKQIISKTFSRRQTALQQNVRQASNSQAA